MIAGGPDLSSGEAATLLGYGKTQVHKMFDERRLAGYKTDGGHRRIYGAAVARLLLERPKDPRWDFALAELRELGVDVDGLAAE